MSSEFVQSPQDLRTRSYYRLFNKRINVIFDKRENEGKKQEIVNPTEKNKLVMILFI